jgi:hypothetical protein
MDKPFTGMASTRFLYIYSTTMKSTIAFLFLFLSLTIYHRAVAQDAIQPGSQLCAQRDSICKRLNASTPAGASITFRLSENCAITLIPQNNRQVTSYSITASINGALISTEYRSNVFSSDHLYNIKKGKQLYIENLKATGTDGGSVKLKPVTLTWK